ncbi:hypothetical protein [uncultured Clostridium sp.]|uniref:hypothetical protein n=1 Tax=uncultured Clostridium sp. TaxID=59620 RepID=UPI0025D749F9|nr:hypothetical protein [uncultured Clostridium sp.]
MKKISRILMVTMVAGTVFGITGMKVMGRYEVKAETMNVEETADDTVLRGENELEIINNLKERISNDDVQFQNKDIYINEVNELLSYLPGVIEESKTRVGDTIYQYLVELDLRDSIEKLSTLKSWLERLDGSNRINSMDIQILFR